MRSRSSIKRLPVRALLCPASLKGVLDAGAAAAALAQGFRACGADAVELPVADGGEGTADALRAALGGERRRARVSDPLGRPVDSQWLVLDDGTAIVEAAAAIGLPLLAPDERDPLRATSRGLGELVAAALADAPSLLVVTLGGTATVDGGSGLREVLGALPIPTMALCDVRTQLAEAARVFAPQKGATQEEVELLEQRLSAMSELRPYANLVGSGAAGGLGAAFAALGAELVPGAAWVLDRIGFDEQLSSCDLVVTGEGQVDETTTEGKAPGEVSRRASAARVPCVVFGGLVLADAPGARTVALSGDPERAEFDLQELGRRLATR